MLSGNKLWARVCICLLCLWLTDCTAPVVSPTPRSTAVSYTLTPTASVGPTFVETDGPDFTPTQEPTLTITFVPTDTPVIVTSGPDHTFTPTHEPTPVRTATLVSTLLPTATPTIVPIPPVDVGVIPDLAWFYKPPTDGATLQTIAQYNTTYILTYKDESYRDNLREMGEVVDYQYVRGEAIHDPDNAFLSPTQSCLSIPFGNQIAYLPNDACLLRDAHPDWFLRDTSGNVIRTSGGYLLMDFGSEGWQQFFIQRILEMQNLFSWHSIFLDNIPMSRTHAGRPLRDYPDDASYQAAVIEFLQALRAGVGSRAICANIIYQTTDVLFLEYARYFDCVLDEAWSVGWSGGYWSPSKWLSQIVRTEAILAQGINVIAVAQGTPTDLDRFRFAYATYLLVAQNGLSFRYSNALNSGYRQFWNYVEFDYNLGQPLNTRYLLPDGQTWRRDYSNAVITVNPTTRVGTITVINP